MREITYIKTMSVLTLLGVLFSGYLSSKKLFTNTCAFGETCPQFLGHPACFYGFGLFALMLITAVLGYVGTIKVPTVKKVLGFISFLGILFAGSLSWPELSAMLSGTSYNLGLPTCVYGLIFYVLIFILSIRKTVPEQV